LVPPLIPPALVGEEILRQDSAVTSRRGVWNLASIKQGNEERVGDVQDVSRPLRRQLLMQGYERYRIAS
jgi:hypothetical protein